MSLGPPGEGRRHPLAGVGRGSYRRTRLWSWTIKGRPLPGALGPVPCLNGRSLPGEGLEQSPAVGLLPVESAGCGWADTVTLLPAFRGTQQWILCTCRPWALSGQCLPIPRRGPWRVGISWPDFRRCSPVGQHARPLARTTPCSEPALRSRSSGAQAGSLLCLQSQGTERMWEGRLPAEAWQLLPGRNPPPPLPLVLRPLPASVRSVAHTQGPVRSIAPWRPCPSASGAPGAQAILASSARRARPHHRATLMLYPACCLLGSESSSPTQGSRFPAPRSCWKSSWAPWLRPSHHPVSWRPASVLGGGEPGTLLEHQLPEGSPPPPRCSMAARSSSWCSVWA